MKPKEFDAARKELGWSFDKIAATFGLSPRTPYRYVSGDSRIPEPTARLLRLLVRLHFTISASKFREVTEELEQ